MKKPNLLDAKKQAMAFDQVRASHQSEIAEDYVELIADLLAVNGEARLVDIAERIGVSHASASRVIERLRRDELVESAPYRSVFLTPAGKALADRCKARHELVVAFLKSLGVSSDVAEIDAEGVEHHVSDETLAAFRRFLDAGNRK